MRALVGHHEKDISVLHCWISRSVTLCPLWLSESSCWSSGDLLCRGSLSSWAHYWGHGLQIRKTDLLPESGTTYLFTVPHCLSRETTWKPKELAFIWTYIGNNVIYYPHICFTAHASEFSFSKNVLLKKKKTIHSFLILSVVVMQYMRRAIKGVFCFILYVRNSTP